MGASVSVCRECGGVLRLTDLKVGGKNIQVHLCVSDKCDANEREVENPDFRCHCGATLVKWNEATNSYRCARHTPQETKPTQTTADSSAQPSV